MDVSSRINEPYRNHGKADVIRRRADRVVDEFPMDALEVFATDIVSSSYEEEGAILQSNSHPNF